MCLPIPTMTKAATPLSIPRYWIPNTTWYRNRATRQLSPILAMPKNDRNTMEGKRHGKNSTTGLPLTEQTPHACPVGILVPRSVLVTENSSRLHKCLFAAPSHGAHPGNYISFTPALVRQEFVSYSCSPVSHPPHPVHKSLLWRIRPA